MRVLMLQTMKGSDDGLKVTEYKEGQEYDLNSNLARVFMEMVPPAAVLMEGVAAPVPDEKLEEIVRDPDPEGKPEPDETAGIFEAPEDKKPKKSKRTR